MLGLVLAMPLASATHVAQAPEWNEGDGWAMGMSVDLDAEFAEELNDLQDVMELLLSGGSDAEFQKHQVQAFAEAYAVAKVAEVSGDEVVLQAKLAARLTGEASIALSADVEAPGTYGLFEVPPKVRKNITMDASLDLAAVVEMEVVLQGSDSSLKSVEIGVRASAALGVQATNMKDTELNLTALQKVISYQDHDMSLDFNFFMSMKAEFSPALDFFNFPLQVGDEWTIDSQMTVTGSYGGKLDAHGLPEELEEEIFSSEFLEGAGVDSFPIDFAEVIEGDDGLSMHDGVIGPEVQDLNANMSCVSAASLSINDWQVTKYVISVNDGESFYYYFDSDGSLLMNLNQMAIEMVEENMELPDEIPLDDPALGMQEISVTEAEKGISEISDYRAEIAGETGSGDAIAGMGLVTVLALVGIAALALVVVAVLVLRKRPKQP